MSLKDDARSLAHILVCERAAADVYDRLLRSAAPDPQLWDLQTIAENHRQAIGRLEQQIELLGGELPVEAHSSAWSRVARTPSLKLFEDRLVLAALLASEASGIDACGRALRRGSDYEPARRLVSEHLLPVFRRNVELLERYLGQGTRYASPNKSIHL